jgi:hypothetical protein
MSEQTAERQDLEQLIYRRVPYRIYRRGDMWFGSCIYLAGGCAAKREQMIELIEGTIDDCLLGQVMR